MTSSRNHEPRHVGCGADLAAGIGGAVGEGEQRDYPAEGSGGGAGGRPR